MKRLLIGFFVIVGALFAVSCGYYDDVTATVDVTISWCNYDFITNDFSIGTNQWYIAAYEVDRRQYPDTWFVYNYAVVNNLSPVFQFEVADLEDSHIYYTFEAEKKSQKLYVYYLYQDLNDDKNLDMNEIPYDLNYYDETNYVGWKTSQVMVGGGFNGVLEDRIEFVNITYSGIYGTNN